MIVSFFLSIFIFVSIQDTLSRPVREIRSGVRVCQFLLIKLSRNRREAAAYFISFFTAYLFSYQNFSFVLFSFFPTRHKGSKSQ